MKKIALLGEFDPARETQIATVHAIRHSAQSLGLDVQSDWISTSEIPPNLFTCYQGIWLAPGGKYHDQEKMFAAIRFAREQGIPCFGTCGGFQHLVLEYARHVLGFPAAQSQEYDPDNPHLFISPLACSLRGREMKLTFLPHSLAARLYENLAAVERYYCTLGVNPAFATDLHAGPMKITGHDSEGDIRVVEWPGHPFFLGTLYVPQARSTPAHPHPLVSGFLSAL